jgi:hypothetical protein
VSKHTALDIREAVDAAVWAVSEHRRIHNDVVSVDDSVPLDLTQETAMLRQAVAGCRRALQNAQKVSARARAEMMAAATGVQKAIVSARRRPVE